MNVLLDVNTVIDALISERSFQSKAIACLDELKRRGTVLAITASSLDTVTFILTRYLKDERTSVTKLRELLERYNVRIISVTGEDFKGLGRFSDVGDAIMSRAAKRVDDEFIVLTRDRSFDSQGLKTADYDEIRRIIDKRDEDRKIPLLDLRREYLCLVEEIEDALIRASAGGRYILGPMVEELERRVAEYLGTKHAIGVASGTDALLLSLKALAYRIYGDVNLRPDDEIITTPFTFVATADTILLSGATPVFVDIDPESFNIDPQRIREYLERSDRSKVKAIIPVHLFGQPCDMDEIMAISQEYDIPVIEDAAQAFGAIWRGRKVGSFGIAGCLSFFPTKNLGGFGDGGMVVTSDDTIAEIAGMLRRHGGRDKYNVDLLGHNSRLDALQAAVLLVRLRYADRFNELRREIAKFYTEGLSGVDEVRPPVDKYPHLGYHVYHQYTIRAKRRDDLQRYLKQKGIQTGVYYPVPLHKMRLFDGRCKMGCSLERAEEACLEVLSLPIEPLLRDDELSYVVESIISWFSLRGS